MCIMKHTALSIAAVLGFVLVLADGAQAAPKRQGPSDKDIAIMKAAAP